MGFLNGKLAMRARFFQPSAASDDTWYGSHLPAPEEICKTMAIPETNQIHRTPFPILTRLTRHGCWKPSLSDWTSMALGLPIFLFLDDANLDEVWSPQMFFIYRPIPRG